MTVGLKFLIIERICGETYIVLTGNLELDNCYILIPFRVYNVGGYIFLIYFVYMN